MPAHRLPDPEPGTPFGPLDGPHDDPLGFGGQLAGEVPVLMFHVEHSGEVDDQEPVEDGHRPVVHLGQIVGGDDDLARRPVYFWGFVLGVDLHWVAGDDGLEPTVSEHRVFLEIGHEVDR